MRQAAGTSALLRALALIAVLLTGNAKAAETYRLVTLAQDLRWPWSLAQLPDGDFLVTEREGRLLRLHADGTRSIIEGGPETLFAGQGGYFDVLVHPSFSDNGLLFLSYAQGTAQTSYTAVYRARMVGNQLVGGEQIFRVNQARSTPQNYGGRMLFLEDGTLLLSSGEGFEHREKAQSPDSELGKILRIEQNGAPAGIRKNPDGKPTPLWTLGHRNPQGLVKLPQGTEVYIHEHGPQGGDELNLLDAGQNYGWPAVTHGIDYSGAYVSPFKSAPGMMDPLWVWTPGIAPSGMAYYDGSDFPAWRGSLLIGALIDREVRRLQLYKGKVAKEEVLFSELDQPIRDVRVFNDTIYLLTEGEQGSLIEVRPLY